MNIKTSIFKRKSGKSRGKWTLRIIYFDTVEGRERSIERLKDKKFEAVDERDRLVRKLEKTQGHFRTGERMTFTDLSAICAKEFYSKAVIVDGRKIEGVRSHRTAKNYLKVLNEFFGKMLIGQITTETLREYRRWRLKNGSRRPEIQASKRFVPIKIATINRELSAMRRMMRFAHSKGWTARDIFLGSSIINKSSEKERTRRLSAAEEVRLLDACSGSRIVEYERRRHGMVERISTTVSVDNPYLKAIILLAVDSGMRRGEILKLRWEDIDFEAETIKIVGTHTKTERERLVPLTQRTKTELLGLREISDSVGPFPFADFKRSWATVKEIAGIDDLRFHDLRRTAITKWIMQGNPIAMAGKLAGHTNLDTTLKHYTSSDADIVRSFAEKMNAGHKALDHDVADGGTIN
ncbi:MAG TPA: site-specific integrase [Aridibacter sp.]|nr:site-specific integrase [Aridibacter sp.]